MEESWRFRPIQGNTNLCPTCSTSHFPFCTPHQYHHHPLPFDHNNGFGGGPIHHRLPNDPSSFQRPFLGNHVNMPPPPPSSYYDDHTKFMAPMIGNPNFVRKFPESPMVGDSGGNHRDGFNSQFDYGSNRFVGGEFVESDRSHKRIKVDEMNSNSFAQIPAPSYGDYSTNQNRLSLEDERRLSLIREHGRKTSIVPGSFTGFGNSPNGTNEHRQPHHYGQINHTTLHSNEPSTTQMGAPHIVDPTRRDLESPVVHGFKHLNQRELYNSNSQQPNVSHSTSYPMSQASHEQFRVPDSQQLHSKDYDPAKDPQNLNFTSWPLSSGSNMPNHDYIHDLHYKGQQRDVGQSFEGTQKPMPHNFSVIETFGSPNMNKQGSLYPTYSNNLATRHDQTAASWAFGSPPLPPVSPPPFPMDPPPPPPPSNLHPTPSPQKTSSLMYSIPAGSSISPPMLHSSAPGARSFPLRHPLPDKPKRVDVSHLLRRQYRATRPDHIVIILRGLPGSGKSYLAKMLRDLEVENGGDAPRIHSMDDYFMTEVEKIEEREGPKASNSVKGRKTLTKKVIEYCYEPEMEEAYRASMLKAFKKTLEEGNFTFIIVDDRNLRVADFAQFWATAKRSGYEVYLLEATYKDPVGCAARNVHGFTSEDIQKMAKLWEEAPSLYLQLDSQSLFQGDALDESGIQEVDMDMDIEDVACDEGSSGLEDGKSAQKSEPPVEDYAPQDLADDGERWDTEKNDDSAGVKELGRSKWSHDDEEDVERSKGAAKGKNSNALSGLIQAYNKGDKSVHWGDQVDKTGFSIAAAKKSKKVSLVIGPGAGYNLTSNPLLEGDKMVIGQTSQETNRRSVFQEHLRAERESFRAVFDRRRHRIGGLDTEGD